jgi:hypothetical protein
MLFSIFFGSFHLLNLLKGLSHGFSRFLNCVTCTGHPSRCWSLSPMLNMHDQERHSTASPEELALQRARISSLYTVRHISPFSGKLSVSSLQMLDIFLATASAIHEDNHRRPRMKPRPVMDTKTQSSIEVLQLETGLRWTPVSLS